MGAATLSDAEIKSAIFRRVTASVTAVSNFAIPGLKFDTQKLHEWVAIEVPRLNRPKQRNTGKECVTGTVVLSAFVKPSYRDENGKQNVYRCSQLEAHIVDQLEYKLSNVGTTGTLQFREGQVQVATRQLNSKSLPAGTRSAVVKFTVSIETN